MDKVASTVYFPCKFSTSGCQVTMLHTDKGDHEEACEFRPYSCPCPGASCKWGGALEQVMPHLLTQHRSITTLQGIWLIAHFIWFNTVFKIYTLIIGEDIVFLATDIALPGAVDWVMMQSCFGHHFMLVLEKQEKYDGLQQFFAIVQLIGTRKQADNFAYRYACFCFVLINFNKFYLLLLLKVGAQWSPTTFNMGSDASIYSRRRFFCDHKFRLPRL